MGQALFKPMGGLSLSKGDKGGVGGEGVDEKGKGLEERKEGKLVGWKINLKKYYFEKINRQKIFQK